jgi:superkiller protein 3
MSSPNLEQILRLRTLCHQEPQNYEHPYNLGVALIKAKDFKAAIESFKQSLTLNSSSAMIHYNLGVCYQNLDLPDKAINAYEDCLQIFPEDDQAMVNLGVLLSRSGELQLSRKYFEKAVKVNQNNLEAWKNLTSIQHQAGEFEQALISAQNAIALDDQDLYSWERLASIFYNLNQMEESLAAYNKALKLDNEYPELWNNLGNCYLKNMQIREAENAYRQATQLAPEVSNFWFNLGELIFHYAAKDESVQYFKKVIALDKTDLEAWNYLAQAQKDISVEEAIYSLEQILALGGEKSELLVELSQLYQKTGQKEKEAKTRQQLAKVNPYDMDNNFKIAQIKLAQGKPEIAYKLLQDCLSISEGEYQTWYRLAQNFKLQEKLEEEFNCLEMVIKAHPDHLSAWKRLGDVALQKDLPVKAFNYFTKASALLKNDYCLWKLVMERLSEKGEYDKALQCCGEVMELALYSPKIWQEFFRHFKREKQQDRLLKWLLNELGSSTLPVENLLPFGRILREFDFNTEAEKLYQQLLEHYPDNVEVYNETGLFYLQELELEQAEEVISVGMQKFIDNYKLTNTLGEIYYQNKQWDEASAQFHQAVNLRNDDYRVWFNLGNIESQLNHNQQALEYYENSITIYAEEAKTWFNKGLVLEEMGNPLAAERAYRHAVYLDGKQFKSWNALAVLEIKRENYPKAKINLLKSLASNKKNNVNAWNNLSIVFERLGEEEKSQSCLREAERQSS